jgi:hypothetical protein
MKINALILMICLFIISCNNDNTKQVNKEPYYVIHSTDFLLLDDLVTISKLPVKDKESLLTNLGSRHKGWVYKGADKSEIALSNKDSKEVLSWRYKENQLVYFLFSRDFYKKLINQLNDENYLFINKTSADNGTEASFFRKNNVLIKVSDVDSAFSNKSFIVIVQPNYQ